jgi:hypothetical protein
MAASIDTRQSDFSEMDDAGICLPHGGRGEVWFRGGVVAVAHFASRSFLISAAIRSKNPTWCRMSNARQGHSGRGNFTHN